MNCADDFLKFLSKWVLENCNEDLSFVSKRIDKTIVDRLHLVMSSSFEKITYAEVVEVLKLVIINNIMLHIRSSDKFLND